MNESGRIDTMVPINAPGRIASSEMFYSMILLVISLPLSEFGMSVAQFLLFFSWLFEGADFNADRKNSAVAAIGQSVLNNVVRKFRKAGTNYLLLIFLLFYFLHVAGLFYTSDFSYGLKDLRVKLPLLTFPVLLATSTAISTKRLNILLLFFALAVMAGSFISYYIYLTRPISDTREISIFISHIRFSLFVAMSIFILIGFIRYNSFGGKYTRVIFTICAIWLLFFLFILKSSTGIFITAFIFLLLIVLSIIKHRKFLIPGLAVLVILLFATWFYVRDIYQNMTVAEPIIMNGQAMTALGNPYTHDTATYGIEYGRYVGSYLAEDEMKNAWNERSSLPYDGLDKKGQVLRYTLIRYLHSKGFHKDAEGVKKLSDKEVSEVENGIANVEYLHKLSPRSYIEQMLMGYISYRNENNPNASSMIQRIEYWKTSAWIISHKPVFGYGTGDVKDVFEKAYVETNSRLLPEFRHRSHNQFLAITIAFGVVGLLIFLVSLFYPPVQLAKFTNYYYLIFFVIALISFLTEDTLETQAGASFFGFFSALFLFSVRKETDSNVSA